MNKEQASRLFKTPEFAVFVEEYLKTSSLEIIFNDNLDNVKNIEALKARRYFSDYISDIMSKHEIQGE